MQVEGILAMTFSPFRRLPRRCEVLRITDIPLSAFFFRVVETMDTAEGIKVNAPLCGHADLQKYPFPFPPPVFFFLNRWASSAV